ncbi:alpha/beta hydrolase [Thermonema rossianum]|uniref:alpha/beta hydrolase n=1 Tax=Thermonema rossianum TaxID=55505 RepID=UPI00056DB1F7|nr:alpha/beta hydrolase [Thermonema rossianum]
MQYEMHTLGVTRTARFYTLGHAGAHIRRIWWCFHGYGQLAADFLTPFSCLDDGQTLLIAPEGLSRFYLKSGVGQVGASWMTKEMREAEIADYLNYFRKIEQEVYASWEHPFEMHLLGFSQGCATVCRWLLHSRFTPSKLILWGGVFPHDWDFEKAAERLRGVPVYFVLGKEDRFITPEQLLSFIDMHKKYGFDMKPLFYEGGHEVKESVLATLV